METTALAAIVSGILADAAAAAGEPGLVTHLIGARTPTSRVSPPPAYAAAS